MRARSQRSNGDRLDYTWTPITRWLSDASRRNPKDTLALGVTPHACVEEPRVSPQSHAYAEGDRAFSTCPMLQTKPDQPPSPEARQTSTSPWSKSSLVRPINY